MKKVGIITFHRAINYGAILQTFALNKFINNNNYDCETIDYRCKYIENEYKFLNFFSNNLKKNINAILNIINTIQRKYKFNKFINKYIKLSEKVYNSENISLTNEIYDFFVSGSDQVWNINLCNDEMFFLPFVKDKEKISYAASFGNRDIIASKSDFIEGNLRDFKLVTVRESSAVKDLKEYCKMKSSEVVDPTFLLDQDDWNDIIPDNVYKEKYILMYILHENSAYDVAKRMSEKLDLPVYVISQSMKKRIKGKYIKNAGPLDFLSLIKNSEYVITDSFHGTALSIIFRKKLKVVLKKEQIFLNDRLMSVLDKFSLADCIVNSDSDIKELLKETNYSDSEKLIKSNIEESKRILLDSLNF